MEKEFLVKKKIKRKLIKEGKFVDKSKIWLLIVLIVIIALIVVIIIAANGGKDNDNKMQNNNEENYSTVLDDGTKINTSEKLKETKIYGNIQMSNMKIARQGEMTVLMADIQNIGESVLAKQRVKITLLDEAGQVITEITPDIRELQSGEVYTFCAGMTEDIVNAQNYTIGEP